MEGDWIIKVLVVLLFLLIIFVAISGAYILGFIDLG